MTVLADSALAQLIDGKQIAAAVRAEVKAAVDARLADGKRRPALRVVLVGDNPASQSYVRGKKRAGEEVGIDAETLLYPADLPQDELLAVIDQLNKDPEVDGILVQLPLPDHVDEEQVILAIDPAKDVDGFHPVSVGRLALGQSGFEPCTPAGIVEMLQRCGIETSGRDAVIVGRSNIVGRPMASLLLRRGLDATVTVCHSRTHDLPAHTRRADILIAAIGRPNFITADMVKPGAAVIDVGINRVDDATRERGYRLVGDVDFEAVREVAGWITPVPGGVGPMTIAMLLQNTLRAADARA
ncbi:MAG: bifunctional methylenetetrahydrofolate dehydrogenase/methenyltetrahydrofolate cyclohydrolase FolD [Rhodothermaceae bacterium]|nr:bifunctional methylenetetrahydrofolate dehydrogenase/methenyltetrahydrofolate cyclohydrolase FolD [Rhodothermaceae bacterium]